MTSPDGPDNYPVPRYATGPGRTVFDELVQRYARNLAGELDLQAECEIDGGRQPEQTQETVRAAAADLGRRNYRGHPSGSRAAIGGILVTGAATGPTIAAGLLAASPTVVGTSAAFGGMLLARLAMRWFTRPDR